MYIGVWRPSKGCGGGGGGSNSSSRILDSSPPMVWHYATTATKNSIGIVDQGACIYLSFTLEFCSFIHFFKCKLLVHCKFHRFYMATFFSKVPPTSSGLIMICVRMCTGMRHLVHLTLPYPYLFTVTCKMEPACSPTIDIHPQAVVSQAGKP